ncbi:MAG TPA: hypothetical protein VF288_00240 [Mycobacteriales bacterium]
MPWPRVARATTVQTGPLLLAWAAIAVGIARKYGDYSVFSIAMVLAGTALLAAACLVRIPIPAPIGAAGAAAALVVGIVWPGPLNHAGGAWYVVSRVTCGAAALLAIGTARWRRLLVPALAAVAVCGAARIIAAPAPAIDVHVLLQQSAHHLFTADMYRATWHGSPAGQLQDVYPYLPWTSVLLWPFRLVAGDVRAGLLVADLAAAGLVARLGRPAYGLLLVTYPLFAFGLEQSWTEPLLIALFAGMVLAAHRGRPGAAVVLFALALATKQHAALLVPLAVVWPAFGWRRTLRAVVLGVVLVLPWFVAGPGHLWHDAVAYQLHYPVLGTELGIPALLLHHGQRVGFWLAAAAVLGAYVLALTRLPRTAAGFAVGGALVELAVDVTNKQSFFNHYTLPMALVVIGLAAQSAASRPAPGGRMPDHGRSDDAPASGWNRHPRDDQAGRAPAAVQRRVRVGRRHDPRLADRRPGQDPQHAP